MSEETPVTRTYRAAVYTRFSDGHMYSSCHLGDFRDDGHLIVDGGASKETLTRKVQELVDLWVSMGRPLPDPKFTGYDPGDRCYYLDITVRVE